MGRPIAANDCECDCDELKVLVFFLFHKTTTATTIAMLKIKAVVVFVCVRARSFALTKSTYLYSIECVLSVCGVSNEFIEIALTQSVCVILFFLSKSVSSRLGRRTVSGHCNELTVFPTFALRDFILISLRFRCLVLFQN